MSIVQGVDSSVSSTPKFSQNKPSGDFTHKDLKPCGEGGCLPLEQPVGFDEVDIPADDGPLVDENSATLMLNAIVTPNLKNLLRSTLRIIEASIPNKDQSKAAKHLVRRSFDDAFVNTNRRSFPRNEIIQLTTLPPSDDDYILDIEPISAGKS